LNKTRFFFDQNDSKKNFHIYNLVQFDKLYQTIPKKNKKKICCIFAFPAPYHSMKFNNEPK